MTGALALHGWPLIALLLAGWALATAEFAAVMVLWRERGARAEAIARASHEMRGPITAVRLGLALCARTGGLAPAQLSALATELGRTALALEDLTHAVATGAARRGPARPDRLGRVALGPLLDEAVAAAIGRAEAAGATVCGAWEGPGAIVWGDRLRLAQALGNLVSNALEHGGGQVRVRGELRGGRARITVDDHGPGLPASVVELARRPRAGRGARGRGLAIAVSIASAHAGSVTAAPAARGGRVVLALPAQRQTNSVFPSALAPGRPRSWRRP
jgi:signal transduction histidine kinase